ncbi:alpha/beta hydrolase [Acidovorax sp. SRB_14]|uniref:alpha/beta fold hydrolase n=1 Tax=unclassified Acidovorax TaxID=2684926 RepID=UPI00145E54EE|nr:MULTISPECIES: alpha/beta hydrolase [unclassified Acidovorax]NMM76134.1 alpha/beta hydrolase [Acidovorax sp. SRB_24]NMM81739.1 alpha/beta hydrolase [Acidovorax sp. SRB_14]NMM86478.1 alpha/beta hydrolase [Rhodococcus sp. SRB_17]
MTQIVFSHGNSFPAGTYRLLFDHLRQRGFGVSAVDRFGHDPQYPVTSNWPHLVQQLADFAAAQVQALHEPVYLVGHSLGGILSVMAAARHPQLVRGVLMLDSPLIGGWRATTVGMAKRAQVVGAVSPGRVSRQRRMSWASNEEALEHFRKKKAFAHWHPQMLQDYVEHGLHDEGGRRVLGFDRAVETAIYNTLPHNLGSLLRQSPLRCPAAFIGGIASVEMRQVGMALTQRVTAGRITMLDGGHLFPMEQPLATAAAIEASLLNLAALPRA